jgi:hypothetical protein
MSTEAASDHLSLIRQDLLDAHRSSLQTVTSPGPHFDGSQRRHIAEVALHAYLDAGAPPPWAPPYAEPQLQLAWRLARHASTISHAWMDSLGLQPLEALEVVSVVIGTVPVVAFARAVGAPLLTLPEATEGQPSGTVAPVLAQPELNWFPVAAPADQQAAVVQALSALPTEWANLWSLASAQYMSPQQMADPLFARGDFVRAQMELVAGRLSKHRECFY